LGGLAALEAIKFTGMLNPISGFYFLDFFGL
jgi:hypothetical protein